MKRDERDLLEVLKFELKFLEDGGYSRSASARWRPQLIFEGSPTCMNFNCEEQSRTEHLHDRSGRDKSTSPVTRLIRT